MRVTLIFGITLCCIFGSEAYFCQVGSYIISKLPLFQEHRWYIGCYRITECPENRVETTQDPIVTLENGTCVSNCSTGTYVYNGKCEQECPETWSILNDTFCTSKCPDDTFRPKNQPIHCDYCHSECDGCIGKHDYDCKQCRNKQYNKKCVRSCPNKTFEDNGKCVDTCLDPQLSHGGKCVDQCPDGFYPTRDSAGTGICQACHPQCKTCNGPRDSQCDTCSNKKYEGRCIPFCQLPTPVLFNGTCYTVCPGVVDNHTCVAECPNVKVQLDQDQVRQCVSKCPAGFYTIDGKCTINCTGYDLDGICVEECPASQYILTHNKTCIVNCPSDMSNTSGCIRSCQQFLFRDKCLMKCPLHYLTDVVNKKCVPSCPKEYPLINGEICTDHCRRVSYDHVCYEKCPNGFPTADTVCVRECPMTHPYLDPQNNQCTDHCTNLILDNKCVDKCPPAFEERNETCVLPCPSSLFDLNGTCVDQCPEKVLVQLRQCVTTCPNGTFIDGDMCQQCHSECSDLGSCSGAGADQCEICRHYKYDSKCVPACPSANLFIDQTNECVKTCPPEVPFTKKGNYTCIMSCPKGYNEIVDDNVHRICAVNCTTDSPLQTPQNRCVSECPKDSPYKTMDFKCVANCPNGSLSSVDKKICVETCAPPAKLQTPNDECVNSCNRDYPFQTLDLNCVAICPNGSLVSIVSKLCLEKCSLIEPLQTPNNECVNRCPQEYPFKTMDNNCVAECKNGSLRSMVANNKRCLGKCSSPTELRTPGNECVEKCPDEYRFKTMDNYCVSKCPNGFLTSKDNRLCVETCSSPAELKTPSHECVKECPPEYPWVLKENGTKSCGKRCFNGLYVYNKECIQKCPNDTFPIFNNYCSISNPENCNHTLDFTDIPCLEGFIDFCTGTCMSFCPIGTSAFKKLPFIGKNPDIKVCAKMTHKIGVPILITFIIVYFPSAIYVARSNIKFRNRNPLLKLKNAKKFLFEDED